ncbi:hypothetical protein C6A36_00040 [Desulfobacteraceae bacterium SEEP-SAG10]|nr:hypothetical protein C6A36_00040 [Desulfobacteraceae bacterium SEEP-SAG10]
MNQKYLNFGCGLKIKNATGWINADIQSGKGIDVSFDFNKFPYPFKDNSFKYIIADNVLEHLIDPIAVVNELWRIADSESLIHVIVPYWNAKCAYNDVTHLHFFNERAVELLFDVNTSYLQDVNKKFEILELILVPSNKCKFLPSVIRNSLSVYLCNIIRAIDVKVSVIK